MKICPKCGDVLFIKETWADLNEEYRKITYYKCNNCEFVENSSSNKETNEDDLIKWANRGGSKIEDNE